MAELTITHTPAEGTLIAGTSRGDGSSEILRAHRWRWSRSLGSWYLPRSRDEEPRTEQLEALAEQLRAEGFTVALRLESGRLSAAERDAARIERKQRIEAAEARIERRQRALERALSRGEAAHASLPPMGQPILVGHHSEGHHRRAIERAHAATRVIVDAEAAKRAAEQRAERLTSELNKHHSSEAVANRIEKHSAEARRLERDLERWADREDGPAKSKALEELARNLAASLDEVEFWQQLRQRQIDVGIAKDFGPDDFMVGGSACYRGKWYLIARVNRKTLTLCSDLGPLRVPYTHLTGARRP